MLPWLICGGLAVIIAVLLAKLWLLRRSLDEISRQLGGRLSQDTNSPIFLSVRDAQARKLASELNLQLKELRRQRQRFQQGDAALKSAVTNISHDLRTPLTAIRGYLDLLEGEEMSEDAGRYLLLIRERTEHLQQLMEEFFQDSIALAAEKAPAPEEISLNRALEGALAAWYAVLRAKGIAPEVSMPEEPVVRRLDSGALNRVLNNILSNAVKYSAGDLSVALETDGTVTFANSAPGMTPVLAEKLFDRYFTVETGRRATGLGLSIARNLAERMGGSLTACCQDELLTVALRFPAGSCAFL